MRFFIRIRSYLSGSTRSALYITAILFPFLISLAAGEVKTISKDSFPQGIPIAFSLKLGYGPIVTDSDSLFADTVLLKRGVDYKIDYLRGRIDLYLPDSLRFDSLYIRYTPLPSWLNNRYGIAPGRALSENRQIVPRREENKPSSVNRGNDSELRLNGAKRFSFLSRTSGGSEFNQSLELTVDGNLSEDLTISGAVSDRGYDPEYGTVNSRINELDKLNLQVKSNRLFAEIGDLKIRQNGEYRRAGQKDLSGMQAVYRDKTFSAEAALGRPRGRFETVRFSGADRVQGPYRINTGRISRPIVPGSEQVWVDGELRQKGADKDYIMDYPVATITFMARLPIDSRSRIEIDFEPLTTDYEQEFYRTAGGLATGDSLFTFAVEYLQEGDDRNRLQSGELSTDDLAVIGSAGDNETAAVRSGAVPDRTGAYVERFDGEGNLYYDYVGEGNGDYRVSFSAEDKGDYRYDGNDRFSYVGPGNGEYAAVVNLPVPKRERQYNIRLGFRPADNAKLNIKLYGSEYDRNLLSELDDGNNSGGRYRADGLIGMRPAIGAQDNGLSFSADIIKKRFKPYGRFDIPDDRRKYMIPESFDSSTARHEYRGAAGLIPMRSHGIYGELNYLDYRGSFRSLAGKLSYYPVGKNGLFPVVTAGYIDAEEKTANGTNPGDGFNFETIWNRALSDDVDIGLRGRFDRRKNSYGGEYRGTTERTAGITGRYKKIEISYERYDEDTLIGSWKDRLVRDRGKLSTSGKIFGVAADLYLGLQRTAQGGISEDQLLARLNWSYSRAGGKLTLSGHYSIIDENRFQRGVQYIEVEPGKGRYILEEGQYIPDPNGDYIEVEEILSEQAGIRNGEKSVNLTWRPDNFYFRLVSSITEEMFDSENRDVLWLLPLYSDDTKEYFLRRLHYSGDIRAVRRKGIFFFNLSGNYNFESRRIASVDNRRYDWQGKLSLHESYYNWNFLQNAELFEYRRDQYYNSPGNISGYKFTGEAHYEVSWGLISGSAGYRRAEDKSGAVSRQILAELNPVVRYLSGGESSLKIQGYYQELERAEGVSYRLTDNRTGKVGLIWILRADYKISNTIRISLYANGRHSDNRRPRFTGKGEMVASF